MKPRSEKASVFEIRARAAKCDALVAEVNRMRESLGITTTAMLNSVALWPRSHWRQLALNIGKTEPSDPTITSVLATLSRAALVDRLASDTEPTFSGDRDAREVQS